MSWGRKGPLEIVQSNPSAQAGSVTAGCSGACPMVFWDPPTMETPCTPWVTCYSVWPPSYGKKHLVFKLHFLYFNLCSTEKSGSASFTLHHLILIRAGKISLQPSFVQFGQPQLYLPLPMCQILLPPNHLCSPSLDWMQYHQLFLVLGAQIWTQILDVSLQHWAEGNNPFLAWRPCSSSRSPGCFWPLLHRHRAKSWSACHPPTAPRPSVRPPSFG